MQKKSKHANLTKPKVGKFARNEWAFLGAPCGEIRSLVEKLSDLATQSVLYIDENHDQSAFPNKLAVTTKMGEQQSFTQSAEWSKNNNFIQFNDFDICLVNGNHFSAEKQFVILDPRKEESLSRKLDRLTNVRAFITTDEVFEPYNFLQDEEGIKINIPSIHINDIDGILNFIIKDVDTPPLKALVLAGGKSVRMGQDKGVIDYHGKGQAEYMVEMLQNIGLETFISCRPEQSKNYKDKAQIHDKFLGLGPFGAIASAFMSDPNAAWIVVPCDLPLLKEEHIKTLKSNRNPFKFGTAYLNNHTQFPEPLISIWEPKIYQRMLNFLTQGYSCPRKVLINSDIALIKAENQDFMTNVNTPDELRRVSIMIEEN